jgi:hypothetical protein
MSTVGAVISVSVVASISMFTASISISVSDLIVISSPDFIFIVVCKKSGRLGIFDCSAAFLARGKAKVEKAVENYRKYTEKKNMEKN